jgi:hypothetical protein
LAALKGRETSGDLGVCASGHGAVRVSTLVSTFQFLL